MTYADYQRMVGLRRTGLNLIPSLVVLTLGVVGPVVDQEPDGRACTTDGNQFACWLDEHG